MNRILASIAVLLSFLSTLSAAEPVPNCTFIPTPKEYKITGASPIIIDPHAVIVIGSEATEPEVYAAKQLQMSFKVHFARMMEICRDNEITQSPQRIVLGQLDTNAYLKKLCKKNKIKLNSKTPGFDGYIIEIIKDDIVIGGSNPRGVTYGQTAFFDLLKKNGDAITFPAVSIRDWPSIAWRGRPTAQLDLHDPISLDVCVHARINWIDIRDVNTPDREATFGYLPGEPIETKTAKTVIDNAHKRGIFVYGTVSCGVKPEKFDAVIATFKELIALGVDGLWISFDDPGPGFDPDVLVSRVIELGKKHNLTGHAIAITPPSGSYQEIDTNWNRMIAKVKGASEALWAFTRIPCARDVQMAKEIGINSLPGWWHNWPRPAGGLLTGMGGGRSLYNNKWAWGYYELFPLNEGWDKPSYKELQNADKYADTVMLWQTCPPEYVCHAFGIWAWDPAGHEWAKTQMATYSYVFGAEQASTAKAFDEKLAKIKTLFTVPKYKDTSPKIWPPRLKKLEDRTQALMLLDQMDALLTKLDQQSSAESMLDAGRLQELYLIPMRDNIVYGRILAKLDYPEYKLPEFAEEMTKLVEVNEPAALKRIDEVRPAVSSQLAEIRKQLAGLKHTDEYIKQWTNYVSGTAFWQEQVKETAVRKAEAERNRAKMAARFAEVVKGDYDMLLKNQAAPPEGKALLEISPEQWLKGLHRTKGDWWGVGLYKSASFSAVAIGQTGDYLCDEGDQAEVTVTFVVPEYKARLILQVFVAQRVLNAGINQRQDVRLSVLRIDRKTLWNQDMAVNLNDWVSLDITDIAVPGDTMALRFRIENKLRIKGYETIALFGPARFIER